MTTVIDWKELPLGTLFQEDCSHKTSIYMRAILYTTSKPAFVCIYHPDDIGVGIVYEFSFPNKKFRVIGKVTGVDFYVL